MASEWTEKEEKLMADFDSEIEDDNFQKHTFKSPDEVLPWLNKI